MIARRLPHLPGSCFLLPRFSYFLFFPPMTWPMIAISIYRASARPFFLRLFFASWFPWAGWPPAICSCLFPAFALMASSTLLQLRPWKDDFSLYQQACSLAPDNSIACNNLAVAFIGHGEYSLARSVLVPVLQRDPNFALANANMGTASYHLGDFPAAEQYLRRAISLNPASPQQYLDLGMICYRTGRLAEAVQLLRHAITIDPAGEGYHVALGTALMARNDYREACDEFRAEVRLHPNVPAAKTLLALCEQRLTESNPAGAQQ